MPSHFCEGNRTNKLDRKDYESFSSNDPSINFFAAPIAVFQLLIVLEFLFTIFGSSSLFNTRTFDCLIIHYQPGPVPIDVPVLAYLHHHVISIVAGNIEEIIFGFICAAEFDRRIRKPGILRHPGDLLSHNANYFIVGVCLAVNNIVFHRYSPCMISFTPSP